VAAAALLAVAAGVAGYLLAPEPPGIRVVTLSGEPGTLAVAFQPGRGEAWVIGADLPAPQGNRVYELWFRRAGTTRMEPAGTFVPRDGRVLARTVLAGAVDLLAVTVEPPGGSLQPTSEPVFVGPVAGS
jgi:anti-sigma-K factor RskA